MKIEKINIVDFGCLSGQSFELSSGFNLIKGDNESGKSTLLEFIKFIFYGMPRKTQEESVTRARSISWKNGSASGSLTLLLDSGKRYRIERRGILRTSEKRESYSEECCVYDCDTGAPVHKGENVGELFLGVPASVFESTCFIRQSAISSISAGDVGSALENILLSADENVDLQKSLDKLDLARRNLLHKNGKGGLVFELEAEGASLASRLEKAKLNHSTILKGNERTAEMRAQCRAKRRELDRLELVFSTKGKADVLKRFDLLHEKEAELNAAELQLEKYKKSMADSEGRLPSAEYVRELAEAAGAYTSAYEGYSISKRALEAAEAEQRSADNELQSLLDSGLPCAEDILSAGGTRVICGEIEESRYLSDRRLTAAKRLTLVSILGFVAAAASAIALILLLSPLYGGIAGGALGIIAAAILTISLDKRRSSAKLAARADSLVAIYGAGITADTRSEQLEEIKTSLNTVIKKSEELSSLAEKTAAVRSAHEMRHGDLAKARFSAEELLSRWRISDAEGKSVGERLRDTVSAADRFVNESSAMINEIRLLSRSVADMQTALSSENEKSLRARISPELLAECDKLSADEIDRTRKFNADALSALSEKCVTAEKELLRLEAESENPARLSALLEENRRKYGEEKLKYDAIVMASEALSNAGSNIRSSVTPLLRSIAEGYLSRLTSGKYSSLGIDGAYGMSAHHDGATRAVSLLSAGTKDGAYLSLRLALLSLIFRDKKPFLAVDEALSQLDDKRAAGALGLLTAYCDDGGQCILFTCHGREEALLDSLYRVHQIEL